MRFLLQHHWAAALAVTGLLSSVAMAASGPPASADAFAVREWHPSDGLPSEDVLQVAQDRAGYLWVATRGTLCRFDGVRFVPCPAPETRVVAIAMVTDTTGDLIIIPREGDPLRYHDGAAVKEPLPHPYTGRSITGFLNAPDGSRWYSMRSAVLRVHGSEVQGYGVEDGISPQLRSHFATDEKGRVWVSSDSFVGYYADGKLIRVPLENEGDELRIASSRHGGPWIVSPRRVLKLDADLHAVSQADVPPLLGAHYVSAALESHDGLLWLGTRSQGVHVINGPRQFQVPTSYEDIYALFEDRDGTMWVGINTGGLNAIAPKVYTLYNRAAGLGATAVSSVCEDAGGSIWVANGDGGVARLNGSVFEPHILRVDTQVVAAISVSADPKGGVWATGGTELFHLAADGGAARPVPPVSGSGAHSVSFVARNGDVWLAVNPGRVGRLHEGAFQVYGPAEGFDFRDVRTFAEREDGTLLAGTSEGRLLAFDGSRFQPCAPRLPSALNAILSVDHELWFGTSGHGLAVASDSRCVTIGSEQGLPDDNITQLVPDAHGNVWCGSRNGVFRLRIEDVHRFVRGETRWIQPLSLGRDEGLRTITCLGIYSPAGIRSRDERIWFATRQGLLAVDPTAEALTQRPPTVRIEQVRIDHRPQPAAGEIVVDPRARRLEIDYSVLCLAAPNRVQTRYRLEGFDNDWMQADPQSRSITYSRLSPGTYRFAITASFGTPVGEDQTATLTLTVPHLWWQNAWVQAAAGAVLVAGITLVVRAWSHRRLRRRIERLERETAVARERARIAQNIHDDVGASLTRISLLTQAGQPHSPEAEKLDRIYETAREITRSLDEIVWAVNPQYDTLESFVSYFTDFGQKFLAVAGIRCRLDIPDTLPAVSLSSELRHDLFLCCREALNNVVKHAGASEVVIRLAFNAPRLELTLADNGRGLSSPSATPSAERISSGHGLGNLRQRMQRIGGSCSVASAPSAGTTVTLTVNLPANS